MCFFPTSGAGTTGQSQTDKFRSSNNTQKWCQNRLQGFRSNYTKSMKILGENIRKISLTLDQAEFLDMTQKQVP